MIKLYIASFLSAFVLVLILTPLAIFLSKRFQIYDYPSRRKIHEYPIPRLGGTALFVSIISTIVLLTNFSPEFKELLAFSHDYKYKGSIIKLLLERQLIGIIIGSTIIFFLGLIDDIKPIRAITKLLVQMISAYCVMDFGVRIFGFQIPFINKYITFPILLTQFITILWLVLLMNSINFIDGLDGLACGICAIISLSFFIISFIQSQTKIPFFQKQLIMSAVLSLIIFGACIGFLFYNFYPAKIFLGDCGALLLGFFIGTVGIAGLLKITTIISLLVPVIIIGVPVVDLSYVIVKRFVQGKHLMKPDKGHIHHLLLKRGWTQREIVLLMYTITLFLSLIAVGFASARVTF